MSQFIRGTIITVGTVDPQGDIDDQLEELGILAEDFKAATTISFEEKKNLAKGVILYAEEVQ